MRYLAGTLAAGIAGLLALVPCASAETGDRSSLDPDFGRRGALLLGADRFSSEAVDLVRLPRGATLIATPDARIFKVSRKGELDRTYGDRGLNALNPSASDGEDYVSEILRQPDGKILVAGSYEPVREEREDETAYVMRLLRDGSPDPDFGGGDGVASLIFDPERSDERIHGMALEDDGSIAVTGTIHTPVSYSSDVGVALLDSRGAVDQSFAEDGTTVVGALGASKTNRGREVTFDASGRLVVVGEGESEDFDDFDFEIYRLLPDGNPDGSFSDDGFAEVAFEFINANGDIADTTEFASEVEIAPGGDILVGGTAQQYLGHMFAVARFDDDGELDPGYDEDGKATVYFPAEDNWSRATLGEMELDSEGRLVVAGEINSDWGTDWGSRYDAGLARLTPEGQPDQTFDGDGRLQIDLAEKPATGDASQAAHALALEPNGRILIAGYAGLYSKEKGGPLVARTKPLP